MNRLILFGSALFVLVACGTKADCPDGTYPTDGGGCAPLDEGDDNTDNNNNTGGNTGGTNTGGTNTGGNNGAAVGEGCQADADCAGNFCVWENGGDTWGICTENCSSWSDCSEAFWGCCDVVYGGSACIPDDWIDRAGLTCN